MARVSAGISVPEVTSEVRGDQRAGSDGGAVQDRAVVGDEGLLANAGAMDDTQMSDGGPGTDVARHSRRSVQDRAVLHVRSGSDNHGAEVAAKDRAVPDRGAGLDGDITDDRRRRRDEGVRVHPRAQPLEVE